MSVDAESAGILAPRVEAGIDDVPVSVIPELFRPAPVLPQDFVPVCLLRCDSGTIRSTPEPLVQVDSDVDVRPFQNLLHRLELLNSVDDIKYQAFLFFGFRDGTHAEPFFAKLLENGCDLVGVNYVEPNVCTALCRRTAVRKKMRLGTMQLDNIYALKTIKGHNKESGNAIVLAVLEAWMKAGRNIKTNFVIDKSVPVLTVDNLKEEWAGLTKEEMESVILLAEEKVRCKRPHTARESFITTMGRKVMAHLTSASSTPACVKYADPADFIPVVKYIATANVVCRTFNVISGELVEFPVLSWVSDSRFKEYTLVLHGDSNLGKTQLAMTMLCAIAENIYETQDRPYFLKVETIEGLKEAASGYIKKGVAILFDDIEPSKMRGTRKGSTLEDLKHLTAVSTTSTLHARFRDIVIDENEPRCFTSNASNPSEWHDGLPADVFLTSDVLRRSYSASIKAVFKRTVFAHVQSSIISEAMRIGYAIKRRRPDMGASSSSTA